MSIKIPDPQTKSFKQIGNSDVLGNIWSSFNLSLSENLGRIRVYGRGMLVDSSASISTLTNLQTPVAFKFFNDGSNRRIWTIAGSRMFYNAGDPDDVFVQDATASTPTTLDDGCNMEVFNNALYVIGNGDVLKYTGTWSTLSTVPDASLCQMCVFRARLYASQVTSQIFSISTSDVVVESTSYPNTNLYTLNLEGFFGVGDANQTTITAMKATSDKIFIGTMNIQGAETQNSGLTSYVFEWDGYSTNITKAYKLESLGVMAMIVKNDIPYVLDANARLLKYNGNDFVEVARFPVDQAKFLVGVNSVSTGNLTDRWIHPNGITLNEEGKINFLINGRYKNGDLIENLPSGIWEYDENIGIYHKTSCSISPVGFSTRTDYAQNRLLEVGALAYMKDSDTSDNDGTLIWGASYYTNATSTAFGIFTNNSLDTLSKVGYLVTTKIESNNVQDVWQKSYVKFKRLLNSSDRIALKYRTFETTPINATITWTSTTTFTSTADLSTVAVGDEVEVTRGTGGGQIEHITAITNNAGTYTVTLENAVVGASGTATARFQKWIKLRDTSDQTIDFTECPIGVKSNWIQLKLVMYFTGKDEVNEIELINSTFKPSV